ncbi:MAG: hypothetical protein Q4F99_06585 [bacterium]|nr:hypothetical protein [bacterium]
MKKIAFAAIALCFASFAVAQDVAPVVEPAETPATVNNEKTFKCEDCGKDFEMKFPQSRRGAHGQWKRGENRQGPRGPRPEMKGGENRQGPRGGEKAKGQGQGPKAEGKVPRMRKEFKPRCKDCMKAKWEAHKATREAAKNVATPEVPAAK